MWDLEIRLAHAVSASLALPANPGPLPIPIMGRVTHVFFLRRWLAESSSILAYPGFHGKIKNIDLPGFLFGTMKKEHVLIFVVVAFIAGFVAGVIVAVYQGEKFSSIPSSPKPSVLGTGPQVLSESVQNQIRSLQAILKQDPKNLKALIEIGNLNFDSNQIDEAVKYYSQALQIDPHNADVRTDLGIMYRRKGEIDKAIGEFKKAAQIDPHHANSRYNLGVILLHDKQDIKGAIQAWEDYLKVEPDSPRAQNIRSQISKMKGMIQ